jgi:hypothetical protein
MYALGLLSVQRKPQSHIDIQFYRLYLLDPRAIGHVLGNSVDYRRPREIRESLSKMLGDGEHLDCTKSEITNRRSPLGLLVVEGEPSTLFDYA